MAGRTGFAAAEALFSVGEIDGKQDKEEAEENAECRNARSSLDHRLRPF